LGRKRLILHFGLQKTGTSSIQLMLSASRNALDEAGYQYPQLPKKEGGVWNSPFRHNIISGTYADFASAFDKMTPAQTTEWWDSIRNSDKTSIVSAEDFSRQKNYTSLGNDISDFSVTVVLYLRRQDKFAESLYNQRNKILVQRMDDQILEADTATEAGLFKFLRVEHYIPILNFERLLNCIETQLKPDKIIVREFERNKLKEGDVCHDFLDAIGLKADGFIFPSNDANEAIPNNMLRKLVNTAEVHGLDAARLELGEFAARFSKGEVEKGSYAVCSEAVRKNLLDQYKDINLQIRDRYNVSFSGCDYS
jgi:hypothetical protein